MNLANWLSRNGRSFADRPAIILGTRALRSYRETALRAGQLAQALITDLGLHAGDRVALFATNGPDYADILYAIWWSGLVAVPVNAKLHPSELTHILKNSGARLLFVSADKASTVQQAETGSLRVIEMGSGDHLRLLQNDGMAVAPASPDDAAWLFYTSGTTGKPKGAILTHRNLAAMCAGYWACIDRLGPQDNLLHAAPMSHGSGIYILPHMACGSCMIVPESGGFEPAEIANLLSVHQNVSLFAAPTMVNRLTRFEEQIPVDGLKALIYGGAPMYVADAQAALARFGPRLVQIYGQGESPMTITCLDRETIANTADPHHTEKLGSVGLPYPNVLVDVVDDRGQSLPCGESGEIIVKGESVMPGYWRNEDATAQAVRNGWLFTGDIGRFDSRGYLSLVDRSKDMVISGGSNIYPREVEEVLLSHPDVREASVIGRPDPEWGEVVVAYIVGDATPNALDLYCLDHIARFKRPKHYIVIDALPKSNYGKILKTALRRLDAEGSANQLRRPLNFAHAPTFGGNDGRF